MGDFVTGIPGGVAIEAVKAIYKLTQDIKVNRNAARQLALRCQYHAQGLTRLFNDSENAGFKSGPVYEIVQEYSKNFDFIIKNIRENLKEWVQLDLWDRITKRHEMAEAIQTHYQSLQDEWTLFQAGIGLQGLALQHILHPEIRAVEASGGSNSANAGTVFDDARAQDRQEWRDTMDATIETLDNARSSDVGLVEPDGSYVLSNEQLIKQIEANDSNDSPEDNEYRKRLIDALAKYQKGNRLLVNIDPSELTVPVKVHRGDHATIYSGFRRGSKVAIKKLNLEVGSIDDLYRRMIRESEIWQTLDHPNIVRFIGCVGPENGVPYMISEWMENDNARLYVRKQYAQSPPIQVDVIEICLSVAKGIVYLHSQNPSIIHGGLKASNILIDGAGNAKVTDFALSAFAVDIQTGSRPPPMRWSSPEILDGNPATVKSDVYSFASVMLEIITDADPYANQRNVNYVNRLIRNGVSPDFPETDVARRRGLTDEEGSFWLLLKRCWALMPQERPTMEKFYEDLARIWYLEPKGGQSATQTQIDGSAV